jgi:hypothetical protein
MGGSLMILAGVILLRLYDDRLERQMRAALHRTQKS